MEPARLSVAPDSASQESRGQKSPTGIDLWSLDEYIVVADLYLRRGRSSGVRDPEVLALAQLTGRTPASISRRLGNYAGTAQPAKGLKPVTKDALSVFRSMEADEATRLELTRAATSRLRLSTASAPIDITVGRARLVDPENFTTDTTQAHRKAGILPVSRTEGQLMRRYLGWLDPHKKRLRGVLIPGDKSPLRVDLLDTELNVLIEAKAKSDRDHVRYAIGQLLDYRRFIEPRPTLAVLLPRRPRSDIDSLLADLEIAVIWRNGDSFVDTVNGIYTTPST